MHLKARILLFRYYFPKIILIASRYAFPMRNHVAASSKLCLEMSVYAFLTAAYWFFSSLKSRLRNSYIFSCFASLNRLASNYLLFVMTK